MISFIFGIGFWGNRQRGILTDFDLPAPVNEIVGKRSGNILQFNKATYMKSGLNREEADVILKRLDQLMSDEKPWLEWELDLLTLADKMDVTTHKLSQVINEHLEKNFYDYINEFRLKEVKDRLMDSAYNEQKILAVAYDCGFNSKSTFYTFFKKYEEMTPTQYRQKTHQKVS